MKKLFTLFLALGMAPMMQVSTAYGQAIMQEDYAPMSGLARHAQPPGGATTQNTLHAKNAMTALPNNYKSFTPQYQKVSTEAAAANKGYERHPELGMLFPETPCDNCYELIGRRTEISKTFIKEGTEGRDIMQQTGSEPMHYRDGQGNWRTIKTKFEPDNTHRGLFAAYAQPFPVSVNTNPGSRYSSVTNGDRNLHFNNQLELIYEKPDGSQVSLGVADWASYTAGDDGVYVTNAWPGVDIEMYAFRGGMKTNFVINRAMPAYADGKLLVRDHLEMTKGLSLAVPGEAQMPLSESVHSKHVGYLEIKNNSGAQVYLISDATVFEKNNAKATYQQLEYYVNGNTLDIALPGNFLNRSASAYPVIIDPLVSVPTTSTIPPASDGSTYSTTLAPRTGCLTTNLATTPANVTVTDIQFANQYTARNGATLQDGLMEMYIGTCRSPSTATGLAGLWWYCNNPLPGTCTAAGGTTYSMWSTLSTCVSPPQCAPYNLNLSMYMYQTYANTAACANTYIQVTQPLIITVLGHTVEIGGTGGITATPATICAGASSNLSVTGVYGVPPYTITWAPAGAPGSPTTVTPAATTTYTVTITDICGITATTTKAVTVNPNSPVTGPTTVCVGNTITLSDATAGGTWSSTTAAVATVVTATGVVTGVATGTDVIKYTVAGGCVNSYTVTVTPLPGTITGGTNICTGNTSTLGNSAAGGTWSSNNTAVATVNATSGVVTGLSAGTATITYSLGGSCYATTNVTITLLTPITGTTTLCVGSTTTLSDATAGGTWASSNGTVAGVGLNSGVVSGLAAGNTTITYTTTTGCTTTIPVTVNLLAPITGNTTICAGDHTTLSDAAPGGAWSSGTPAVATADSAGDVAGLSGGTTTITYRTPAGCSATTVVTVNPLPNIANVTSTNPTTCGGSDGSISLTGLSAGTTYSVDYTFNGTSVPTVTLVANASTLIFISGLFSGTYANIYVTNAATGCVSNIVGPVTLVDPAPPPPPVINSNAPICIGQTLLLSVTDPVQGGTYSWVGPNAFTSTDQQPEIVGASFAASGPYTATYTLNNCPNSTTSDISIYPPLVLTNVTASQTIPYGASIQLNADGALYYMWQPNDGSLSNPNINNPIAVPRISTIYIVVGTNLAGCKDTATVNVTIDSTTVEFVPSAFTPNGDGLNDVFRITNMNFQKLVQFNIYNRWGTLVYNNSYDPKKGWDGTFNGVPQDMGVYNYSIIVITAEGVTRYYKGDLTLIR